MLSLPRHLASLPNDFIDADFIDAYDWAGDGDAVIALHNRTLNDADGIVASSCLSRCCPIFRIGKIHFDGGLIVYRF